MNKDERTAVFYMIVLVVAAVLTVLYFRWQFNLCYPAVTDNIWYCIAHAL